MPKVVILNPNINKSRVYVFSYWDIKNKKEVCQIWKQNRFDTLPLMFIGKYYLRPLPHSGAFLSGHKRSVARTELYIPEEVTVNPCAA